MSNHPALDRDHWNTLYNSRPQLWSGKANPILVEEGSRLTPGRALDLGSGEGGDAIWLAQQGWQVTAVDISDVALQRARADAVAREAPDTIDWTLADLTEWQPPGAYDLVNAQFFHHYPELRDRIFRTAAAATAPGGTLLVVGHPEFPAHADPDHEPPPAELLFSPDAIVALLDPAHWRVERHELRDRTTNHTPHHVDGIVLARRLG